MINIWAAIVLLLMFAVIIAVAFYAGFRFGTGERVQKIADKMPLELKPSLLDYVKDYVAEKVDDVREKKQAEKDDEEGVNHFYN